MTYALMIRIPRFMVGESLRMRDAVAGAIARTFGERNLEGDIADELARNYATAAVQADGVQLAVKQSG